jgi:adenylate cyclase
MAEDEETGRATLRVFAIAALALVGLAFSATPVAQRWDAALLDLEWSLLRKFDRRAAPDDIIIVGLDDAAQRAAADAAIPLHEPIAKALGRIAAVRPRAIALDLPLPERSLEKARPGLDRMMLTALAAARDNGPFVAIIDLDARTRAAKPIYPPYLAVMEDARLSLAILTRDEDGVTRRFSLSVPTEDGGYPTLAGRLCRALSKGCDDGLLNYALGQAFRVVPIQQVITSTDAQFLERLFRNRIVMIGDTGLFSDRVAVPVNLAGWEPGGATSPGVVVHAQALRTALLGAAPARAGRPFTLLVVTLAALLVLMRGARLASITLLLAAVATLIGATLLLRGALFMPIAAPLFTLALAWLARAVYEASQRAKRRAELRHTFSGRVTDSAMRALLQGKLASSTTGEPLQVAVLAFNLRPGADMEELRRSHETIAAVVHRHGGMLDTLGAHHAVAVFGALPPLDEPSRAAARASEEVLRTIEATVAATYGEARACELAPRGPMRYTFTGPALDEALQGGRLSDFQHP